MKEMRKLKLERQSIINLKEMELTAGIMGNLKQHLAKNYIWRFITGN
jgi:hypothetical protein